MINGGEMKFEKNENKLGKLALGLLAKHSFNVQSAILLSRQMAELMSLCKFWLNQKWKLIYRATRDGFGSNDFHSKCDSYQNSLVIIKSTNGNVFGGYTEQNWSGASQWKSDPNAFLFSFINHHNTKIIMKCINPTCAIRVRSSFGDQMNSLPNFGSNFGPTFGGGADLFICNDSNTSNSSCSNLGVSYKHPNYGYGSDEAKSFLAGSYNFRTKEIEVYTKE